MQMHACAAVNRMIDGFRVTRNGGTLVLLVSDSVNECSCSCGGTHPECGPRDPYYLPLYLRSSPRCAAGQRALGSCRRIPLRHHAISSMSQRSPQHPERGRVIPCFLTAESRAASGAGHLSSSAIERGESAGRCRSAPPGARPGLLATARQPSGSRLSPSPRGGEGRGARGKRQEARGEGRGARGFTFSVGRGPRSVHLSAWDAISLCQHHSQLSPLCSAAPPDGQLTPFAWWRVCV